jgi:polar amino acid transport system substrate-binding protein
MKDEGFSPKKKSGIRKNGSLWLAFFPSILCCLVIFSWFFVGSEAIASAATFSEIENRGYLIVAVKDNLRPLGFRDESGNLQGWEIDLAKHLASDLLGKADAVKFQPVNNQERLTSVFEQKVDLAIARVTATESRSRLVSFSVPYYFDSTVLITKDPSIAQLQDLSGCKIAVLNNSSTIAQVKYFLPHAKLSGVDSYKDARSQMENHTADAFAADASVLSGWIQEYPEYKLIPTQLSAEPLSIVMPKGLQYDGFRRKVNEAIARYTATGWFQKNSQKWKLLY